MAEDDDVSLEKRGNYHVIIGTNVVVHLTEDKILGLIVQEEDEWYLTVPTIPTPSMRKAAQMYDFELPPSKKEIYNVIEMARTEINYIYTKMPDLYHAYDRLEELQNKM